MPTQLVVGRQLVPSYSIVEDAAEKAHYAAKLCSLCAVGGRQQFPGSNPVGLTRPDLSGLSQKRYVIALKSDGVRHMLFLTVRPGSTYEDPAPVALMVDRALNMHEVETCAPEDYFLKGTVLDGELVARQPNEETLLYLVFDCLVVKGERLGRRAFRERISMVQRCVLEQRAATEDIEDIVEETDKVAMVAHAPNVSMRVKTFVERSHAPWLWSDRSMCDHRVDGLILQDEDAPYNAGAAAHGSQYKWKATPTIDLAGPAQALCVREGALGGRVGGRAVQVDASSEVTALGPDDVLEYSVAVGEDAVRLFALRRRPDKKAPNSRVVVEATIKECVDAIDVSELAPDDATDQK